MHALLILTFGFNIEYIVYYEREFGIQFHKANNNFPIPTFRNNIGIYIKFAFLY